MIHVEPAIEPPDFDRKIRQPGLSAIAELVGEPPILKRRGPRRDKVADRREDIPSDSFPTFWRNGLDDMMQAYNQICAYMAIYIENVTGAATIVTGRLKTSHSWAPQYQPPLAGNSIDRFNNSRWLSRCRKLCFLWPSAVACSPRASRKPRNRSAYSITPFSGSCFLVLKRVRPGGRIGWF
jgi:hypothetical protein